MVTRWLSGVACCLVNVATPTTTSGAQADVVVFHERLDRGVFDYDQLAAIAGLRLL
jgi:hypothetical protein